MGSEMCIRDRSCSLKRSSLEGGAAADFFFSDFVEFSDFEAGISNSPPRFGGQTRPPAPCPIAVLAACNRRVGVHTLVCIIGCMYDSQRIAVKCPLFVRNQIISITTSGMRCWLYLLSQNNYAFLGASCLLSVYAWCIPRSSLLVDYCCCCCCLRAVLATWPGVNQNGSHLRQTDQKGHDLDHLVHHLPL